MVETLHDCVFVYTRTLTNLSCLQELLSISDAYVESTIRQQDASQGKWLTEDPSLAQIQQVMMTR